MKTAFPATKWNSIGSVTGAFRGYDPALEDLQSLKASCESWAPAATDAPESYSVRSWLQIENQGTTPSCGGHALSTVAECAYHVATRGKVVQLSRWFAWLESQKVDGGRATPNRGISIQAAAEVAKTLGLPLETLCPFQGEDFDATVTPEAYADAATRKLKTAFWIESRDELFSFLQSGAGAAVIGVPWNFNRRAWHAVALTGWRQDAVEGANSWGADFGDDGFFYWEPDVVDRYFRTSGVACVGLSDMDSPHVRDWDWYKDFLV